MFPMHLGSRGAAQIGGLVKNSGGVTIHFGMMQDLVLTEVVLADGKVWNGSVKFKKIILVISLENFFAVRRHSVITKAVLNISFS